MKLKRVCAVVLLISILFSIPAMASTSQIKQLMTVAKKQIGKPYKLSSHAPSSFNCATFITYCFNKVQRGTISKHGINAGYKKVHSMGSLKAGDIVCYKISDNAGYGILNYHFGIYTANGYMVHASRTAGKVIVSKVRSYDGNFLYGLRIF